MLAADMRYWDIRPHPHLPTLEVRSMDVPTDIDATVAITALIRAMVVSAAHRVEEGDRGPELCSELLRAAYWRAARDGWAGSGIDVLTGTVLPCADQAAKLVAYLRPVLEQYGDRGLVKAFLERLEVRGSGADVQRSWKSVGAGLNAVVYGLIEATNSPSIKAAGSLSVR